MKKQPTNAEELTMQTDSMTYREEREISEAEIAQRAYQIYQSRGGEDGADLDDWLQAERELNEMPSMAISSMRKGAA